jgi:hypothetical protein
MYDGHRQRYKGQTVFFARSSISTRKATGIRYIEKRKKRKEQSLCSIQQL